jgi:hypothetical protein
VWQIYHRCWPDHICIRCVWQGNHLIYGVCIYNNGQPYKYAHAGKLTFISITSISFPASPGKSSQKIAEHRRWMCQPPSQACARSPVKLTPQCRGFCKLGSLNRHSTTLSADLFGREGAMLSSHIVFKLRSLFYHLLYICTNTKRVDAYDHS